jgi:c(7)-type cytochrome triheme protein
MKILVSGILIISFLASFALARVGGGNITFEVKKGGNVIFSHESHVGDIRLKCTDCHDYLYVTKEKHKPVTMAQMQRGASCGSCHNGKKAFDVKTKENCNQCHKK